MGLDAFQGESREPSFERTRRDGAEIQMEPQRGQGPAPVCREGQNGCSRSSQQGWGANPAASQVPTGGGGEEPGTQSLAGWRPRVTSSASGRGHQAGSRKDAALHGPQRHNRLRVIGEEERGKRGRHVHGGSRARSPCVRAKTDVPAADPRSDPAGAWSFPSQERVREPVRTSPACDFRMGAPARGSWREGPGSEFSRFPRL